MQKPQVNEKREIEQHSSWRYHVNDTQI